ncbi:CBS domain-containing protein [Colwellia sp. 4_MG-2023]|uniref:CBS domain-containing protein n=1 Tax=unclassified Colwellia TaxID=196834 RepID=UPI001C09957A|nr:MULTISPECIES: CBS domain-containing protein [unclassified Colwellia]MBU2926042.1 CBS domain-containing protein [Colwellia sp. C2M11]MDO6487072.1 CBS domain-containing protein [Colwellia sp. 6_MG-2023]MDO6507750.1 CBS domain-containing protein [Colwellia sp. 5_MG-2023]MDO6556352.1 CBS domain-containing protein [Colwellia sp. 4_MG-2023]MDO6653183.1 CBS domain-containing protein [Colwellia sp. 3_MG-2023]
MSVKQIMTSPVITIELDDNLTVVGEKFSDTKFHHLLVVEHNKLFGVVSDRDLLKAISPKIGTAAEKMNDVATLNKKVHQIMTRNPICIQQEQSVHDAIALFLDNNISCIPVVDSSNIPVGIISWRDILKTIKKPKSN